MTAPSDQDVGLAKTMLARRNGLRNRMAFASIYAVSFGPIAGWRVSLAWIAVYTALQAVEFWFFAREAVRARPVNRWAAISMLSGNSIVYGALGILSILAAGPWGVTCGGLFLAGAVLNTVVTNQRSQVAYIASMTPFGAYLLVTAALAWLISGASTTAVAIGAVGVLLVFSSTILWKAAADGLEAQRRSRAEAERGRAEAESLAAAKSTFIAMVSHELRTPISAILAGAEAIRRDGSVDPAVRSNAALIGEAGRMMGALLNDLLDLSKMEAGRMNVETLAFAPRALIADTVAFWRAQAEKKGLALVVEGANALPEQAAGDPTRLRQILNNLFSNAIKFTDVGKITLSVAATRDVQGWSVRLSVTDTGAGMTEDQQARLFTPFDQTRESTARTHGGTGLGLVISRELARLMGGDLLVRSAAGRGSTFTLAVGFGEAEAVPEPAPGLEGVCDVRVLVVDDHEVNRRAVALMLEPLGVALTAAASAAEALDLLFTTPFDVILMDIHMPGMGGCEAARVVRTTNGPNASTPIIACTGSTTDKDLEDCAAAGMNAHVAKPIDAAALHAAIARVLEPDEQVDLVETAAA